MKQKIPMLLLITVPYLFVTVFFLLIAVEGGFSARALELGGWVFLGICIVVFLPCGIYPFFWRRKASSSQLLFWDMILKICNIPIYILVFVIGVIMAIFILGIPLLPFLFLFDGLLLLPSTMYGISGLMQARKEGRISSGTAILNGILHFLFCLDCVSAVVSYLLVRSKKTDRE